jgi:hypothetical protein
MNPLFRSTTLMPLANDLADWQRETTSFPRKPTELSEIPVYVAYQTFSNT